MERAIIFIDHANVLKNLDKIKGRIDWEIFKNILKNDSHLVGVLIYVGKPKEISKGLRKFYSYLEKVKFVIQPKPVQISSSGKKKQKGVDIFMYKEIVELAEEDAYDRAIIVSGDGDFVDAVQKLKQLKKKFDVWSFKISLSRNLAEETGRENIHYIEWILDDIEFKN